MANVNSSPSKATHAISKIKQPLVTPYSYSPSTKPVNNDVLFADRTLTISRGAKVIADILRMDVVERDSGRNPVLDVDGIEALAGLLSESMFSLSEMAEQRLDDVNCGKA